MGALDYSDSMRSAPDHQYVHGFSRDEQDRLYRQARFFEPLIHQGIDLSEQTSLLEVGCGVGAQTEILMRRYPDLQVTGIDASKDQLKRAKKFLSPFIQQKRVKLTQARADQLPFKAATFDSAFLCWFLEHVASPLKILREVKRTLKPGALVYANEVMHASFFVHPYSPATLQYWFEFNDHQWNQKGDPFVGAKLGNLLKQAGFKNIRTEMLTLHCDNRKPKLRAQFIQDLIEMLLSAAPVLLESRRVTPKMIESMKEELLTLQKDPNAVVLYSWIQASAEK